MFILHERKRTKKKPQMLEKENGFHGKCLARLSALSVFAWYRMWQKKGGHPKQIG